MKTMTAQWQYCPNEDCGQELRYKENIGQPEYLCATCNETFLQHTLEEFWSK